MAIGDASFFIHYFIDAKQNKDVGQCIDHTYKQGLALADTGCFMCILQSAILY